MSCRRQRLFEKEERRRSAGDGATKASVRSRWRSTSWESFRRKAVRRLLQLGRRRIGKSSPVCSTEGGPVQPSLARVDASIGYSLRIQFRFSARWSLVVPRSFQAASIEKREASPLQNEGAACSAQFRDRRGVGASRGGDCPPRFPLLPFAPLREGGEAIRLEILAGKPGSAATFRVFTLFARGSRGSARLRLGGGCREAVHDMDKSLAVDPVQPLAFLQKGQALLRMQVRDRGLASIAIRARVPGRWSVWWCATLLAQGEQRPRTNSCVCRWLYRVRT